ATITGSIGVVGGKLVTTDMWGKVGITFKPYQRGKNAGLLNTDRPWTPAERDRIQGWMNEIYDTFKQHVTDIRGPKLKKPLEEMDRLELMRREGVVVVMPEVYRTN